MIAFYKETDYFGWAYHTGHGMDASSGYPEYKLYWQDTAAIKTGDTIEFEHRGGADNLMIRTGKIFNNAAALYLASGDMHYGRLVREYSKGIVSLFYGMLYTDQDPEIYLMPRAAFTVNHSYTEDGNSVFVDYEPAKVYRHDWNAHTIPNAFNPISGDGVWIRNMRSKDDVPHIYRTVPMLMRLVEDAPDADVVAAATEALEYLEGFARDIVDSGYHIRTKDMWGNPYIPIADDSQIVNDLASFVLYTPLLPNAECDPRLASALIAYGDPIDGGPEIQGETRDIGSPSVAASIAILTSSRVTEALLAEIGS